jgi:exosortase
MNLMKPELQTNARLNAIIFLATLALFAPTWFWLIEAWWSDPYYSHGPLVLLAAIYFAWTQRRVLVRQVTQSPAMEVENWKLEIGGWLLIVAALAAHLWAMLWRAYYISALMIPIAILGLLVALYGWRIAQRFWFPLAFLILLIPLPLAERFGPALEGFAATSATALAQFIGIAARNDGAQVFLPNSIFTVGIPCGGLRSIIAIITLVVLLAYIVQGRAWARALIVIAAIPIALAANTLRLALLFAIANFWGSDAAMNYFHDWSSPVLFLASFALLLALAKLVGCDKVRWDVVMPGS